MKRTRNAALSVVPSTPRTAPFIDAAFATRMVTVEVRSGLGTPDSLNTSVKAVVTTDTYFADPDGASVAIVIDVQRTFDPRTAQRERFDIPASELDVFVVSLTEAVRQAKETGVIAAQLTACAEVRHASQS